MKDGLYAGIQITGTNPVVVAINLDHSGFTINSVSGAKRINSAGQHGAVKTFATEVKFTGTIPFTLDSTTLGMFAFVVPTAPTTPPPAKIYPEFTVDDGEYIYSGCKCSGFKASLNLNNEVTCTLDFTAKSRTASATVITITPLDDPWIAKGIALTGFPSDVSLDGIDITVANGLKEIYSMIGTVRSPEYLAEGYHNIDLDFKFNENPGVDVAADALAPIASATIVMKTATGAAGGTFTLTNVLPGDNPKDSKPEDVERFGLKYTADVIALAAAG